MDLRRLLNATYAAIIGGMSDEDRDSFDQSISGETEPKTDHRGRPILRRPARPGSGATASPADLASVIGGAGV